MKILSWMLLAIFIGCANQATRKDSQSDHLIHFDVKERALKNGLKVFVVENDKLPLVSYFSFFEVGGKHETPGLTGASHLLEHMMFKGGKKYPEKEFDKIVEGNGGRNNAYTTNDMTVYYESVPAEHLSKIIDLEADRMQNLALNPASFESEKQVVLEERKMRYENADRGKLYLEMMSNVFAGTAYGTSVIGSVEDIKSVTREEIFQYFKRYYAPNNAFVLIVGDVDASKTLDEMEKAFGDIPSNPELEKNKREAIAAKGGFDFKGDFGGRAVHLRGTSKHAMFMLAFKGIEVGPREAYALDILSSMLGSGESSYLNQNYVLAARPRLSHVYAGNFTLMESGVFYIGGQLLDEVELDSIQSELYNSVKEACSVDFTERELQKVKNQYLVSYLSGLDTNEGIARFLGNRQAYYGDYNFYKKELATYDSITLDEVKNVCSKRLTKENSIFLSIWDRHPEAKQ